MRLKRLELMLHIVWWVFFVLIRCVDVSYSGRLAMHFNKLDFWSISYLIISAIVFYVNYFLLVPIFSKKNSVTGYAVSIIISYFLFVLLRFLFEEKIALLIWGFKNYYGNPSLLFYMKDNIYFCAPSVIFSTAIGAIVNNMRLTQENAAIKVQQAVSELKFLKAQVNPHFIFNTLNNIYSLVYSGSSRSLKAIEALSAMMRYTTYEAEKDYIYLQQEADYIQNLIVLEQLRLDMPMTLCFEKSINDEQELIPPFTLSPFVENILKHGIVDDPLKRAIVNLQSSSSELIFETFNYINLKDKNKSSGIGLENIRKRLNYYYSNRYSLEYKQKDDRFETRLIIKL